MLQEEIIALTEEDTIMFVKSFARSLKNCDIVTLEGDLGSGKTFICREIIRYFCGDNIHVTSPTFNILQTYNAPNFTIYHFDLYRLKNINEIYELGIEDALSDGICLIEWCCMIRHILPKSSINVSIDILENNHRKILINSLNLLLH